MVHSCDVYFYTIGAKAGIDNLAFYGDMVGFGHATGIDLPHEASGIMPSSEWKLRTQRHKWYAGETPSVAIGQGAITVTPLQLARAIGGLAIGGTWHHPHLVKTAQARQTGHVDAESGEREGHHRRHVRRGERRRNRRPRPASQYRGLRQDRHGAVGLEDSCQGRGERKTSEDNAWFEGFAPCYAPEIVVVALFEHLPEHGQYAAPHRPRRHESVLRQEDSDFGLRKQQLAAAAKREFGLGTWGLGASALRAAADVPLPSIGDAPFYDRTGPNP